MNQIASLITHRIASLIRFVTPVVGNQIRFVTGLPGRPHITPSLYMGAVALQTTACNLTGDLGSRAPPMIRSYYTRAFRRPAQLPTNRMAGAELLLLFDVPTNRAGLQAPAGAQVPLSHLQVANLLSFEPVLGYELRGSWLSPQALRVEVVDAGSLDSNLTHQSQHPPAPASWRCGFATYGTGDGCDCACGAHDPDCDDTSTGNLGAQLGAWNCMPGQVCVAPGVCSGDVARVQLRGLGLAAVRTSSGSSAPSLSQTPAESIAASIPSITSFVAADPNDGDSVASVGDTLTIHFDGVTNYAAGALRGNRSFVDDIFRFSTALGNDYTGEWVDSSMFVITLVDASQSLASVGRTSVWLRQDSVDSDADGTLGNLDNEGSALLAGELERLASQLRTVLLSGTFGDAHLRPDAPYWAPGGHVPGIVQLSFVDNVVMGARRSWSEGDALRIRFDSAVNVKPGWPTGGGMEYVNALFQFSQPLGAEYSGSWRDASVFVIEVLTPGATAPPIALTTVHVIGSVRGAAGNGLSAALSTALKPAGEKRRSQRTSSGEKAR
jgi:hypothetical protein